MAENKYKQTRNGQELKSHWISIRFEIVGFILWRSIVSLFKNIVFILVPAADRRAGGRFSLFIQTVFAIVTLEGPRLLLMSRYRAARMETGTKVGLSAVSGTAIAAIVLATIIVSSQLMAVTIDGRVVGYVENEEQYASLLQRAKEKISEQVGTENTEILIQDTNVSLEPVIAPQQQPLSVAADPAAAEEGDAGDGAKAAITEDDPGQGSGTGLFSGLGSDDPADPIDEEEALIDTLIGTLLDGSAIMATVYNITIDDKIMATLGSIKEASEVLNKIAEPYIPLEGEYNGKFREDVKISSATTMLDSVDVQEPDEVVSYLLAGVREERTYVAEKDDGIELICEALGITEDELTEFYGEYDFDFVRDGDTFSSTLIIPYLSYETVGIESFVEDMQFETIEENTSNMFLGQRKVKEEGELGIREVTRAVTRVNGKVDSTVEINSVTLKEPVPELVLVGTMMVGTDAFVGPSDNTGGGGNGPLGRPLNSWFLSRSVSGGHSGADMIAPRGAPIFAAQYGTVTFAGVYGGYGNLLIVNHGNGLQTYYAHCDTLNVEPGTVVQRGQQIATVGSTGRSSAFHLHFEVRVNGVAQEPMNWIS